MMLEDEDYQDAICNMIRNEMVNAEYAVAVTGDNFAEMFASMDDDYMQARSADVRDISNRLVQNLSGNAPVDMNDMEPSIIVADDLSPSETVQMDKDKILGFVTVHGSTNSHTAILARMMNIPALIGVPMDLDAMQNGMQAVVDGFEGCLLWSRQRKYASRQSTHGRRSGKTAASAADERTETVTKMENTSICMQISEVFPISRVCWIMMQKVSVCSKRISVSWKNRFSDRGRTVCSLQTGVTADGRQKVIIRTLDIGADKQVDYFNLGEEENPAMGYRAIRICLKQPEIFKTQLRALLRAAVYGNLSVMYPMITSTEEVEQIFAVVEEVRAELEAAEIPYKMPEQV